MNILKLLENVGYIWIRGIIFTGALRQNKIVFLCCKRENICISINVYLHEYKMVCNSSSLFRNILSSKFIGT